jgi:phosphatidylserine/phosphatidylglycerophosphate/cardiolipin synthase-like enzyme
MKLTDFTLRELSPYILGDNGIGLYRSASKLVDLFNLYGCRDIYEFKNGGLPKLNKDSKLYTTRKDYTFDRLRKINNTKNLKDLIEKVVSDYLNESFVEKINKLIVPDKYRLEKGDNGYFIVSSDNYEDNSTKDVLFEDIQKRIIDELSKAKAQVLIAVAWFTDPLIYSKLIELKAKGVNVQLILIDDNINKSSGLDYSQFETIFFSKFNWDNLMHNKFCVIDLLTVINGSYNWTKKAQYNKENITVDYSKQLADKFVSEFMNLKTKQ